MNITGLVRVTVAAPNRRIDLALPERTPLAELLPGLLRHAGDHLADQAARAGGWLLRRADGEPLDAARTLAAHRVLDGEVLHLVHARTDWPELEYDDVVDAIAAGSARAGATWEPRHTRWGGLAFGAAAALLGLVAVLRAGPPWSGAAPAATAAAAVLLVVGIVLARAAGDAGAGALVALVALPFAFVGGALLPGGDLELSDLGPAHLLAGSTALAAAGVVALLGVVDRAALFACAATAGLLGVLGAWPATAGALAGHEAAAVLAGAGLVFSPLLAPLAMRLARVPMPVLPRGAGDLLSDLPQPPRSAVYATVVRADALLTGMLTGVVLAVVPCLVLLVRDGGTSGLVLVAVLAVGLLLRARLYPVVRHRAPLLAAGGFGAAALALGPLMAQPPAVIASVLLVVGGSAAAAGLLHAKRAAGPFLGRAAQVLEVLVVLAVVPTACAVLGLYGYLRGLGG
ncbi:type VII secretion integral membrane protein EccD [Saccharothrix sp. ALI-22-I]|uniref:type VII secretion integral membrane protein EccD n=1 Tax=Saccharothrix sp. ALI-22-I TaxID=1933778 RepID=UPI00097BFDC5|nr:type VII secretion integral membrane protein EccD [Saccharothrix sp. ALI-22-I]ONI92869.1 type VII secretion integral membrane protein EccD [Saccharothrix sp. ALI-22-I]